MPAAVGVDIGCGMIAVKTDLTASEVGHLDRRVPRESIEQAVPTSADKCNATLTGTAEVNHPGVSGGSDP